MKDWLPLLEAPDVGARRFAIEKIGDQDSPRGCCRVGETAIAIPTVPCAIKRWLVWVSSNHGREALAEELLEEESPEETWLLLDRKRPWPGIIPPRCGRNYSIEHVNTWRPRTVGPTRLFFVLRETDAQRAPRPPGRACPGACARRSNIRAPCNTCGCWARDPALGEELRFQLAACGLKVSPHDLSAEGRSADPSLDQFARLIHSHETDPLVYIQKAAWLDPEDLLYLGFHFAEGSGADRNFGGEVLKLALKRSPRSQVGKDAKSKLRSSGLI